MRSGSESSRRGPLLVAVALSALASLLAPRAEAYRHGLGSSIGGASLGRGHVLYLATGYPRTTVGWAVALGSRFDLGLHGDVVYGSSLELDTSEIGGGGGLEGRVALVRGRVSGALLFGAAVTGFKEGGGATVFLDLGSPSAEISVRLNDRLAFHTALRVVVQYITRPSNLVGGFEARCGVTVVLRSALAMIARLSYGATIWNGREAATTRLETLLGLELRLGH